MSVLKLPPLHDSSVYERMTLKEQAEQIKILKEAIADISEMEKQYKATYEELTVNIVPDRMDEEGVNNINYEGIGRLQTSPTIQCSVLKDDQAKLKEWMVDNGHGALISETINYSTLKAWTKEQMMNEANEVIKDGQKPTEFYPKHLIKSFLGSKANVVKA